MSIQQYDRHSTTAKGVDETVNWNMKHPRNSVAFDSGAASLRNVGGNAGDFIATVNKRTSGGI
ncbi:MAG TPA: hypothetical protein VEO92_04850 [Candidatus Nitrosocosmicus sp.]|nr:hypothetical protein [Candidatus Nitrosocosmicus sp.]